MSPRRWSPALFGYATSFIIARFRHLALIMITLGIGLLLAEAANSAGWLTGGVDGLQGMHIWPLLGMFRFDLYGYTAYAYALVVLFLLFLVARRLIHSPFGLALRGIRENVRAHAGDRRASLRISAPSTRSPPLSPASPARCWRRPPRRSSLDSLGFERSADVLVMLVLGGTGRLYGGLIGAIGLHGGARPVLRHRSAILVFLDRRAAGRRGACCCRTAFSAGWRDSLRDGGVAA